MVMLATTARSLCGAGRAAIPAAIPAATCRPQFAVGITATQRRSKGTGQGQQQTSDDAFSLSKTLYMPKTSFPMRANGATREIKIQHNCFQGLYPLLAAPDQQRFHSHNDLPTQPFILHDGPPFANGPLHMGHVLNKTLKDIIVRYRALRGAPISFIPGWDFHGLPIEAKAISSALQHDDSAGTNTTKRALKIRGKALKFAQKAVKQQMKDFMRLGVLADWENPYITATPAYEKAQLQVFFDMLRHGLVERRYKPVYWSPSSRTALAEAEIEYQDHVSTSIVCKFPATLSEAAMRTAVSAEDLRACPTFLLIWTTTPWTLPANQAVSVNADLDYYVLKVPVNTADGSRANSELLVVAKEVLDRLNNASAPPAVGDDSQSTQTVLPAALIKDSTIVASLKGVDLIGSVYQHPFSPANGRMCPVIHGSHVTSEAGTGLVHTAPAHGVEDFHVCLENGMAVTHDLVDEKGCFHEAAGQSLAGLEVLGAGNRRVVELLRATGQVVAVSDYTHRYPHDWRTHKPIILRATMQWFAQLGRIKDPALQSLVNVDMVPEASRSRLTAMLQLRDEWCISRQRNWGVPIPVFFEKDSKKPVLSQEYADHILALVAEKGTDIWWKLSDDELLPVGMRKQGVDYEKSLDTMDVWFDSGSSWKAVIEQKYGKGTQADVYLEGSDQHRGWFQSSLLTKIINSQANAEEPRAPYKTIITHGFVLDEKGRKMSKSLGNGVDPTLLVNGGKNKKKEPGYGADIVRFWAASSTYQSDVNIGPAIVSITGENVRKIRNSARFLLGNLDDFRPEHDLVPLPDLHPFDRYFLHVLATVEGDIRASYDAYAFPMVTQSLLKFVTTELSSFYVEVVKDRLYLSQKEGRSRRSVQTVLQYTLNLLKMCLAPIAPHLAEELHHFRHGLDPSAASAEGCGSLLQEVVWDATTYPSLTLPAATVEKWDTLRLVRRKAFQAIQKAREAGEVNSSLDSDVHVAVSQEMMKRLADITDMPLYSDDTSLLNAVLLTSKATLSEMESPQDDAGDGVAVHVRQTTLHKCDRCWRHVASEEKTAFETPLRGSDNCGAQPTTGTATLCKRCIDVLTSDFDINILP